LHAMAPIRKPSAAMDGRRVAMDPSILDAYVENRPWNSMTGGSVASGPSLGRGTFASWDGLSVDPRPFSRLDTKPLPGVANPYAASQGMAGAACFEVGPAKEGGALCHKKPPPHAEAEVPLTVEQQLSQRLPGNGDALAQDAPTFINMFARAEEVVRTDTPAAYKAAELSMQKGALITPAQRRAALDFQIKNERARATVKRGELQARRLHHLLRDRHPQGALNVDSTANPDSYVYGAAAREIRQRDANHKMSCDARRANLTKILCGETTHGYDPFQHDESLKQEMNRFLQAKTFGKCRPSHSTHERLFTKHEKPRKDVREQFIRDRELEGRPYDIVGHYTIERLPSHVPQRVNTQLAHPSQNGKEGRCTQGSLGRTPCLL